MQVPFLDLKANYRSVKQEILEQLNEVLDNTSYILGPKVEAFERTFGSMHKVKHCIAVSSGTDANHLALWALGVKPGDEVIVPANTFIATAWGATLCGATPVFADCHPESYNLDPDRLEAAITPRTKAIVAVHLYGQPADMDAIMAVAGKHGIPVVEDAAQAHLAEYKGRPAGGIGAIASFSFYPGKNLGAYGEGGAVTTNQDEAAARIRMFRDQGQSKKYYHEVFGHNYRMESIQGAVLNVKLKYLAKWTEQRRHVAQLYRQLLSGIDEISLPAEMSFARHVYHLFVIQCPDRDNLQKHLSDQGIATGLHYPVPLHLQKCFGHLGYKRGDFPVTEKLAANCLSLPVFPEMTEDQVRYVAEKIKACYTVRIPA